MRRKLAALAAAAMLSAPMSVTAPPSEALAAPQFGLINVSVDENNICALCNTAVAVQAVVQACDTVDVGNIQALAILAAAGSTQTSTCEQDGEQVAVVLQGVQQEQEGGRQGPLPKNGR